MPNEMVEALLFLESMALLANTTFSRCKESSKDFKQQQTDHCKHFVLERLVQKHLGIVKRLFLHFFIISNS